MTTWPTPRRIIVPIDISTASEQAIPFATMLAGPGDEIVLLHVVTAPDRMRMGRPGQPAVEHIHEQLYDAGAVYLRGLADEMPLPEGVTVGTRVVDGPAADQIVAYAKGANASLIVMTTAGRGAAGRLAFGSVADQVARTAAIPVVLVRLRDRNLLTAPPHLERVLVPLDGSDRATRALEPAAKVAKQLNLPVTVMYVMEISDLSAVYGTTLSPSVMTELVRVEDEAVRESLNQAAESLKAAGVRASWKILSGGWAGQEIEDEVTPSDFVVMASHGRGGVRRWLFGSVAERLVRAGRSPVMLVPSID